MSYSETITKNDLKKILGNIGIGTSLSTTVGSFTLNSGWTGDEIEVKQFGDVVMVKGYFVKSGGTGTDEIAIGNISGVSLPTSHVRFRVGAGNAAYNATNSGYGILAKSGQLSVKLSSSQTTVTVELTYIAAHSTGGYKYLIDMFHPVGSYYETSDANFNPNTAWGGTWVKETEQVRTASWTATSTNTNNAKVTNSLMLPAGTYIGWIKIPVCSQETALIFTTNLGYETGGMFTRGQSVVSFTFTLSAETEIYAQTNMSHATNYTYIERGYLKVVRISSHIGSRWHRTA